MKSSVFFSKRKSAWARVCNDVHKAMVFLHTSVKKIELFRYSVVVHKSYLTLLVWLLVQDKNST